MPIECNPFDAIKRKLIASSPVANMIEDDRLALLEAFTPPGVEYPMIYIPNAGEKNPNMYRDWLISILDVLTDCYPHPVNMALDCLRTSLIEVNRGLKPNLFKPASPAKGGLTNFAAQKSMNLAVLAANYIHDELGNDESYEQYLSEAQTSRLEIDKWRKKRIDPAYRRSAIVAWYDLCSAKKVLEISIEEYRKHSGRKARTKPNGQKPAIPAS